MTSVSNGPMIAVPPPASPLSGLTGGVANILDTLGGAVENILDPVGGSVNDVVGSIADLLRDTGSSNGGLLGNLFEGGLLGDGTNGGGLLGIGMLDTGGGVILNLLGTEIAVLPENGGIVTVDADGLTGTGGILDLGGLLGTGGLLNLTDLVGDSGVINLNEIIGSVLDLLDGGLININDYTDENGDIDPSKFENVFNGTIGRDHFSIVEDVSTYVNGKEDIDVVDFGRSAADMTVTVGTDAVLFTDNDTLFYFQNVERVNFFEGSLYLDTGAGENAGVGYRLYQAAFDRIPDGDGVKYWVDKLDGGLSFADAAAGFVSSAEFAQTYGNLTNADFVDQIYENVLGRAAEAAGTAYWNDYLTSGHSRADVLIGFSESAENVALVAVSIENGYTVA